MRITLLALLASTMVLSACGGLRESRMNPANWFGRSTSTATEPGTVVRADGKVTEVNPLIGERQQRKAYENPRLRNQPQGRISLARGEERPYDGTLVGQVESLVVERTSTGAIVRATGITTRQGAFDVRLVPLNDGTPVNGVLSFELRAVQPLNTFQGAQRTRQVQAGAPLSVQTLEEIREVRVIAQQNTRTTRR
jgi:hypothetical protein